MRTIDRVGRIRTCDPTAPSRVLCQTELLPEKVPPGVEPGSQAYHARVLPLDHETMETAMGLEPTSARLQLAAWCHLGYAVYVL